MAQIQRAIFFLCFATVYAASITNLSEENFSTELEEPNYDADKDLSQVTDNDPLSPSSILSGQTQLDAFQMGKSLLQALMGLFQILRQMDLSQDSLKNLSHLVASMVSVFAGQYYETLKKLIPVFSGMAIAFLETLR